MSRSPYSGIYVQDFWRVHPSVTLNLGLRYDRWHAKSFKNGAGGSFDLKLGKAVAGEENGKVNLNSQPVAKYLAPATADLWVPASQAGMDGGLFKPDGYFSPRLGATWRPFGKNDFVVRGGYGMFMSSFRGNHTASSIVGLPFWTIEAQAYSSLTLQSWDTAWPQNPRDFVLPSVSEAPAYDAGATANHEWNLSIQKGLPFKSAITVSYLGARIYDQITLNPHNEVAPGRYPNLQAAKPWPRFGDVSLLENIGNSWYNGLQLKFERRFTEGLSYTLSYSFAKHIQEKTPASDWGRPAPFAPEGYHRGRSEFDRTHILAINTVYELPFGKGRKYMSSPHPVTNAILGGWQLTGIYYFTSGYPLSFSVPGATLGNGWGTRPNLVGNHKVSDPTTALWFNPAAFAAPPQYAWGNSGIGLVDGPGSHTLDAGLMKNFYFNEQRYIQFRWEMFNAPNHVNYGNPVTTFGLATTGKIFGAGSARQMQAGLKFIF